MGMKLTVYIRNNFYKLYFSLNINKNVCRLKLMRQSFGDLENKNTLKSFSF